MGKKSSLLSERQAEILYLLNSFDNEGDSLNVYNRESNVGKFHPAEIPELINKKWIEPHFFGYRITKDGKTELSNFIKALTPNAYIKFRAKNPEQDLKYRIVAIEKVITWTLLSVFFIALFITIIFRIDILSKEITIPVINRTFQISGDIFTGISLISFIVGILFMTFATISATAVSFETILRLAEKIYTPLAQTIDANKNKVTGTLYFFAAIIAAIILYAVLGPTQAIGGLILMLVGFLIAKGWNHWKEKPTKNQA